MSFEIRFRAMGSRVFGLLESEDPEAQAALQLLPLKFENWEDVLSRFRPESELSRLNLAGGAQFVSSTLIKVMRAAEEACLQSAGLINPLILPALEAAGYDRSFDILDETDFVFSRSTEIPVLANIEFFDLNNNDGSLTLPCGSRLDLGGVAKGWAVQEAMQSLAQWGPVLINAGGDIAISAPRNGKESWLISLLDPFQVDHDLLTFAIDQGGLATSGRDLRRWEKSGKPQHHIIDPRTKKPADTDVISATVLAPDILQAEMASKIALILGSREGMDWLESRPEFSGLFVLEDGQVLPSSHIRKYILEDSCLPNQ